MTVWDKIARSIEAGRLGWQINVQGKRTLLGVPDKCRQWVELLIEKGHLELVPSGTFRILKLCSEARMRQWKPLHDARVQAAQRRTNRVVRPEDVKLSKFCDLDRPSNYGKGPTIY